MKHLFLFSLLALSLNASAQVCCPYIDDVTITPSTSPDDNQNVSVILTVTTPNLGAFVSSNVLIDSNNILVTACYYSGMLTALGTYVDTVEIGILPAGDYNFNFEAYLIEEEMNCSTPVDTNYWSTTLTVNATTNNAKELFMNTVNVFPNPANSLLRWTLPNEASTEVFEASIFNTFGQLLLKTASNGANGLEISQLPQGNYVLVLQKDNAIFTQRFVKE